MESVVDSNGLIHNSEASKEDIAAGYFSKLFKLELNVDIKVLFHGYLRGLNLSMNSCLVKLLQNKLKHQYFLFMVEEFLVQIE